MEGNETKTRKKKKTSLERQGWANKPKKEEARVATKK